jgi:hypothetical protein
MKLILSAAVCFLPALGCSNSSTDGGKTNGGGAGDSGDTENTYGQCELDPTWICPEVCDRMTCAGMTSECIRACSAELQDCDTESLQATCACFETHLADVVCQTWEAAQPAWDSCIGAIGCFDDY